MKTKYATLGSDEVPKKTFDRSECPVEKEVGKEERQNEGQVTPMRRSRAERTRNRQDKEDEEAETPRKGIPTPFPLANLPKTEAIGASRGIRVIDMRGGGGI